MSRFNLDFDSDVQEFLEKVNYLISKKCIVDLIEKRETRTTKQNSYLHALICIWALDGGWTIEEAKRVIKIALGYAYVKNGETFIEHTSNMNTKELSVFIEAFRNWSAKNGLYLYSADEYNVKKYAVKRLIDANKQWLY